MSAVCAVHGEIWWVEPEYTKFLRQKHFLEEPWSFHSTRRVPPQIHHPLPLTLLCLRISPLPPALISTPPSYRPQNMHRPLNKAPLDHHHHRSPPNQAQAQGPSLPSKSPLSLPYT